jgi:TonB family protein
MRLGHRPWLQGTGWATSVLLHLGAFVTLATGVGHAPNRSFGPTRVSFEVVRPVPRPEAPPAAPAPPPPLAPRRLTRIDAAVDSPSPARPPAPADAPVDLTGVTLTGDGAGWSSVVGNGEHMDRPIETPRSIATTANPAVASRAPSRPAAADPAVVPLASLSRRPVPPRLDSVLRSHYPADARQRGLSGVAVVRARIETDGRVRIASVLSESYAGFGEACRRTLLGSDWLPSQDRVGRPVATEVSYTCHFKVEP